MAKKKSKGDLEYERKKRERYERNWKGGLPSILGRRAMNIKDVTRLGANQDNILEAKEILGTLTEEEEKLWEIRKRMLAKEEEERRER